MATIINADTSDGLKLTSDTSGEIQFQSAGVVKAQVTSSGLTNASGSVYAAQPSFRNFIINGDQSVAQRGTSSTGQGASEGFKTVDRWNYTVGSDATAGRFTLTQDTADAPTNEGFGYCTKFDCTTADTSIAAGEALVWRTKLEGQMLQSIKKGTANAEPITFSFWAKGTAATYVWEFLDEDNNRNNTNKFTVSSTWQKFTITLPADTTGAFNNDNGASLAINLWLHAGANYSTGTFVSNTWATRTVSAICTGMDSFYSSTSNEFFLTGLQLEIGSSATDFEFLPYDVQLARCQRYYTRFTTTNSYSTYGFGMAATNARMTTQYHFPTTMRTAPSTSYGGTLCVLYGTSRANITSSPDTQLNINGGYVNYDVSGTPFTSPTYSGLIGANNDVTTYVDFSAEI